MEDLQRRLTKSLHRLALGDQESVAAGAAIRSLAEAAGLHVTDLCIHVNLPDGRDTFSMLIGQLENLKNQLDYYAQFAPRSWEEFSALSDEKLVLSGKNPLAQMARALGVTTADLQSCKQMDRVPRAYIQKLLTLPDRPAKMRSDIDDEVSAFIEDCFYNGMPMRKLARVLTKLSGKDVTIGQISGRIFNNPSAIRTPIHRPDSNKPLTPGEIDAMAHELWGRTSFTQKMKRFVLDRIDVDISPFRRTGRNAASPPTATAWRIRELYFAEQELRRENDQYRRMSLACALVVRPVRSDATGTMSGRELEAIAAKWFGADYTPYLAGFTALPPEEIERQLGAPAIAKPLQEFLEAVEELDEKEEDEHSPSQPG